MTWASRTTAIKIGDRVPVSARFLRSIGQHTGDLCFCRGKVIELKGDKNWTLAVIEWESLNGRKPDVPEKMLVGNLNRVTEKGVMDSL